MNWTNDLTQLLKIKYPIIQAPMLGVTTPEMVAAVSNEGGLGSLPVGLQSPEKALELIRKTKSLTAKPFAVNLFAHDLPEIDPAAISELQDRLLVIAREHGLDYNPVEIEKIRHYSYREQIEIIIAEHVPVVSFTFGVIDQESIRRFHEAGILLIGTATSVREAQHLESIGIDVITAQGIEAGGHRGTFLFDEPLPQVGSMSLIPQVTDQVKVPVLAAGGIMDGRSIKAAMILGALGVQVGSAFLRSDESLGIDVYKDAVADSADTETVLTRAFSGRWARGIRNTFHDEVEKLNLDYPAYPLLNDLTVPMRTASQKSQNKEFTTLWAGQSARLAKSKSSAEIFRDLVIETEELLKLK
ncbi:nitronate monooxygenase family protein [Dyadobacter sp. CY312]|uniref:NAD(P)H-dependent flavin oxidoreductase n=1 Tax=Dyadobacter sp. CY312 TaxID=2907303 RepID=UPI001F2E312A|nr:nitronate monooxygenase [Dyadobacter sp. CY312]MCE7043920.1 nitronate monooxygenase [Dyadobacter sp. CY312]